MAQRATFQRLILAGTLVLAAVACDDDDEVSQSPATGEGDSGVPGDGDGDGDDQGTPTDGSEGEAGDGDMAGAGMMRDPVDSSLADNGVSAEIDDGEVLPILCVHGFAGSAQQYQSQAMRWVSNGYPEGLIYAYDHDGAGRDIEGYADGVDEVIDGILQDTDYDQVYLIGHSRGTSVSTQYLSNEARAAKVAKYISLDGRPCPMTVACLAPTQMDIPGQAHVEVATSAESFAMQYEFIMGEPPETTKIEPQEEPVVLSGRAVNFPANTGRDGATLEFYEIDTETGERVTEEPLASFEIDASGDFGPVTVDGDKFYEMRLYSADGSADSEQHIYTQRNIRSSTFVRVLSQDPETSITRSNSNLGPDHATMVVMRMREWYETDVLEVSTQSDAGDEEAVNVIVDAVGRGNIALHLHDAADSPSDTSLDNLPYFPSQPFQTGLDVFMPAADPPNGTITVTNYPRGDMDKPQTLAFPNWSSDKHSISVMFSDYAQD